MIRRYLLLTLAALAVASPMALGATRPRDHVFAGETDQGLPAYVKVLPHNRIEAVFAYTAKCDSGDVYMLWAGATKLASRRGRFAFTRGEDDHGPQITLQGRIAKRSASGTWKANFTLHDDSGAVSDRCQSDVIHWKLKASALGGQSSAGYPVALTLAKRKVRTIQLVTQLSCQSGRAYFVATPYDDFPTARDGSFGDSFTDSETPEPGTQVQLSIRVAGKVRRSGASGSWRISAVVTDASGKQVDSCDSGPLTWRVAQ